MGKDIKSKAMRWDSCGISGDGYCDLFVGVGCGICTSSECWVWVYKYIVISIW